MIIAASRQSEETVGTKPVEEYLWFAKHAAALDWFTHQGNDFEITPAFWDRLRRQIQLSSEEGRFIGFLGYEWSGNTALGGDRNVFFPTEGRIMRRSSHALIEERPVAAKGKIIRR